MEQASANRSLRNGYKPVSPSAMKMVITVGKAVNNRRLSEKKKRIRIERMCAEFRRGMVEEKGHDKVWVDGALDNFRKFLEQNNVAYYFIRIALKGKKYSEGLFGYIDAVFSGRQNDACMFAFGRFAYWKDGKRYEKDMEKDDPAYPFQYTQWTTCYLYRRRLYFNDLISGYAVKPGSRTAILGCGNAPELDNIVRQGGQIWLVDINGEGLSNFRENYKAAYGRDPESDGITLCNMDAVKFLETAEGGFDLIIASGLISYLNEDQRARFAGAAAEKLSEDGTLSYDFQIHCLNLDMDQVVGFWDDTLILISEAEADRYTEKHFGDHCIEKIEDRDNPEGVGIIYTIRKKH